VIDDRACLERARCSKPANGRLRDAVGSRKIGLHGAFRETLDNFLPLVRRERLRTPEFDSTGLGAPAAAGSQLFRPSQTVGANVYTGLLKENRDNCGLFMREAKRRGWRRRL
jgi:hypothetical protein